MTGPPEWLRDIAPKPQPQPVGPIERALPRPKKPPQPMKKRNEARMAKRNAESFGEQAALCRRRPCLVPGCRNRPSVPHHTRTRAAGGKDDCTVPLCFDHHSFAHDHGNSALEEKHGVSLEAEAAKLAAELERKKGHDCEKHARLIEREPGLVSFYRCTVCNYVIPTDGEEDE